MSAAGGAERLTEGLTNEVRYEVTPAMVPGHVRGRVLSTPSLVSLIEGTCRRGVLPLLDQGYDTVGVHVCVSHERTARVGEEVEVAVRLVEIERRRLTFDVLVRGPRGDISRGTHRRVVVDTTRFE